MRYIRRIFTQTIGHPVENAALLPAYEECIDRLDQPPEEKTRLRDFVRYSLMGQRSRYLFSEDLPRYIRERREFRDRARSFEAAADEAVRRLACQIEEDAAGQEVTFDAVISTTSSGNLMPGLSYRLARCLPKLVRTDSLLWDLGNVGCTGGLKALNLARILNESVSQILILAVEVPTTGLDTSNPRTDAWQGYCTFGDGAAALWVSSRSAPGSLAVEELRYAQQAATGLELIHFGYRDYYTFELAEESTFESSVKRHVLEVLQSAENSWRSETRWAIHPAGISLLLRLSRGLGIPRESLQPSLDHYRRYSNMSSASILHILKEVAADAPVGSAINLLSMGAGFNVIYGRVRREA